MHIFDLIRRHVDPDIDPTSLLDTNCWFWRGAIHPGGYPRLKRGHPGRLLFLEHYNKQHPHVIPEGVRVRILPERCEQTLCINPRHYGIQPYKAWDMDICASSYKTTVNDKVFPPLMLPDDPTDGPPPSSIEEDLLECLEIKDRGGWWNAKYTAQHWLDEFEPTDFTLELIQAALDGKRSECE